MRLHHVEFSKYNPAGNMTVLVHSEHDSKHYGLIAQQLMSEMHLGCEQVGFIEENNHQRPNLVMSGQEFCGNATLCFIHYLKNQHLLERGQQSVEVSGREDEVVYQLHEADYYEVTMPKPTQITTITLDFKGMSIQARRIEYPQYLHFVIAVDQIDHTLKQKMEQFLQDSAWQQHFKTVGVMLYQPKKQYMEPLIYVPAINSMIWERSCASGSASVGMDLYHSECSCHDQPIVQPGGTLTVSVTHRGHITIKGAVHTVATGMAYIETE